MLQYACILQYLHRSLACQSNLSTSPLTRQTWVLQESVTTKQMLDQFVDLAGKKVTVEKRPLTGPPTEAFAAAVRQEDVHLLAVPVSAASEVPITRQLERERVHIDKLAWACTVCLLLPRGCKCNLQHVRTCCCLFSR